MKHILRRRAFLRTAGMAAGAAATPAFIGRARAGAGELNIIGSTVFLPKDIREKFSRMTGVQINLRDTSNASQDFNLLVTQGDRRATDMAIIPAHRYYSYIAVGVLDPVDPTKLPGMSKLNPIYRDAPSQFIGGQRFGVPIAAGFNLIGSRKSVVPPELAQSWNSIFGDRFAGRVTMRPASALYAAMFQLHMQDIWLNYDGNSAPIEAMLKKLRQYVISRRHVLLKWYNSTAEVQQLMIGDEVDVAQGMNEGIMPLVVSDPSFARALPIEGCMGWTENYCLIKGGRNQENAYKFINFLLNTPGASASMVRSSGNVSTFLDTKTGLSAAEIRAYSFGDADLSRVTWLDMKGVKDNRQVLVDKYTVGLADA